MFFTPLSICNDFAFYLSACLEIITLFLSLAVFEANEKWSGCLGFGSEVGADVHWKCRFFFSFGVALRAMRLQRVCETLKGNA